jgi:hypothetical protein
VFSVDNLFFQLEREYILQIQLGFTPDYEPNEIFDPADPNAYKGPPLPSRYQDLILLKDWHLPGKEKRRKRRHRKTHGRIGFQELSLKIADAWKNDIDSELRQFLNDLCDVGLAQYKIEMLAYKAMHDGDNESITTNNLEDDQNMQARVRPSLFDTPNNAKFVPTGRCSMAEIDAAFENDLSLSIENLHESMSDLSASCGDTCLRSSLGSSFADMVDLEDDDILEMWKSAPVKSENGVSLDQGTVVSSYSSTSNFSQAASRASEAESPMASASASSSQYGQNSCIDTTMDDLKNMRKAILNQQIQMQSSIMAARRLTKGIHSTNRPGMNGVHGYAARSA